MSNSAPGKLEQPKNSLAFVLGRNTQSPRHEHRWQSPVAKQTTKQLASPPHGWNSPLLVALLKMCRDGAKVASASIFVRGSRCALVAADAGTAPRIGNGGLSDPGINPGSAARVPTEKAFRRTVREEIGLSGKLNALPTVSPQQRNYAMQHRPADYGQYKAVGIEANDEGDVCRHQDSSTFCHGEWRKNGGRGQQKHKQKQRSRIICFFRTVARSIRPAAHCQLTLAST